jgi:myo-inositol-1(or 4)-monophosphatase
MSARERHVPQRTPGGELARELEHARTGALEAGKILRRHFRDGGYEVGSKGRDNPVTSADLEADAALRDRLSRAFPDYGWLSEETADSAERLSRRRVWIVDPLDGTKEFIKGIPEFVIAIALAENGVPILGVTYNPIRRELFWGARGVGVHLDNQAAHVTTRGSIDGATVLASRSETSRGEWEAYKDRVKIDPIGSVAYKLALVAAGRADATFTLTPKSEWDVAAGTALVTEAGGRITDLDGSELRFNKESVKLKGFIASNGLLHGAIESMIGR